MYISGNETIIFVGKNTQTNIIEHLSKNELDSKKLSKVDTVSKITKKIQKRVSKNRVLETSSNKIKTVETVLHKQKKVFIFNSNKNSETYSYFSSRQDSTIISNIQIKNKSFNNSENYYRYPFFTVEISNRKFDLDHDKWLENKVVKYSFSRPPPYC